MFVWGDEDPLVPLAFCRHVSEALPEARQVVMSECGHVPQVELPEETNGLVHDFMATARTATGRARWPGSSGPASGCVPSSGSPARARAASSQGPSDHADRGNRAQVLDQHVLDGESALAQPVGQLVPEVAGSPRRGVASVPEDVDRPVPGEMLADGTERRLRLQPERSDVEGEDLVEAPVAEVRVLKRGGPRARPCQRRRARGSSVWPSRSSWVSDRSR